MTKVKDFFSTIGLFEENRLYTNYDVNTVSLSEHYLLKKKRLYMNHGTISNKKILSTQIR